MILGAIYGFFGAIVGMCFLAWYRTRQIAKRRSAVIDMMAANMTGLIRKPGETDEEFRARIKELMFNGPPRSNMPHALRTRDNKPAWLRDEDWFGPN